MKLHDNSRFRGEFVVLGASANLLKSHGSVEFLSGQIGFAHLQKNGTSQAVLQRLYEFPRQPAAAEFGVDREVQDLAFRLVNGARHEKSGNPIVGNYDS